MGTKRGGRSIVVVFLSVEGVDQSTCISLPPSHPLQIPRGNSREVDKQQTDRETRAGYSTLWKGRGGQGYGGHSRIGEREMCYSRIESKLIWVGEVRREGKLKGATLRERPQRIDSPSEID